MKRSLHGAEYTIVCQNSKNCLTILAFRHLLEKHDLGEQIFETVKDHLSQRGMTMRQGTIGDATLIAAPSSTKNKKGKCDPEMHQAKKGNQWYFDM